MRLLGYAGGAIAIKKAMSNHIFGGSMLKKIQVFGISVRYLIL
jgi:hypothetical protein